MMVIRKIVLLLVVCVCLANRFVTGAEVVRLEPNAKLSFEFPDLPDTLQSVRSGEKVTPQLSAQLPENYSRDGQFPLVVYLHGGSGGHAKSASTARELVGPRNFIAVSLPLFKEPTTEKKSISVAGLSIDLSLVISGDDSEILQRCYRIMLQKLFDTVPNIERKRSAIGGYSNGAHAAAALVAKPDKFIADHFTSFYLIDGGLALLMSPVAIEGPHLKNFRFLVLRGDPLKNEPVGRTAAEPFILAIERRATVLKLDFTSVIMHGYGHAQPPEYLKLVGNWVRGEKLPEIEKK